MHMEVPKDHEENRVRQIESSPHRPGDVERAYLCDQLQVYKDGLYKLDKDIAIRLAHRSRINKHINRCVGALAPYSKLPVELIEKIIKYHSTVRASTPLSTRELSLRLQITQICSSWRLVAFGVPTLWNVCFEELPTRGIVKLVAAWFRQCSSNEIRFGTLKRLDWSKYTDRDYFSKKLLVPYSHRFTTLSMLPHDLPRPDSSRLDRLTTLEYSRIAPWTMSMANPIVLPSLRSFGVFSIEENNHSRLLQDLPPIPWGQLTDITLQWSLEFSDVYDILRQCTSLESCVIGAVDSDSLDVPEDTLLDLPHLKTLKIEFGKLYTFDRLFMFNAPNLTSLAFNNLTDEPDIFNQFTIYVTRLRKTLRTFKSSINGFGDAASVDDIMQAVPFVVDFDVKRSQVLPETLAKVGRGELLPNVEVLHLEEEGNFTWKMMVDSLVPVQQSRQSRLRDIYLDTYQDDPLPYREEELRALGVNLHRGSTIIVPRWL